MAKKTVIWMLSLIWVLGAAAQAETTLNGEIKLDERVYSEDSPSIEWNRATLLLKTKAELSEQVAGYGELKIRTQDSPRISDPSDLTSQSNVTPISTELREAYIDIFGIPLPNMDLRAGKQRIAWGTADKLNQVDLLNPYDFTDILEFGKKIPTNALKLTAYLGDTTLTAVALPLLTPAAMPSTYTAFMDSYVASNLQAGLTLVSSETSVSLPDNKTENSMYALKFSRNIAGLDMSLSYFKGRDSIPNLENLTLTAISTTQVSSSLTTNYPEIQVLGYDLAGTMGEIGFWAEVASITPHNLTQTIATPLGTTTTEVSPYTKYTVGFDGTLPADVYINAQFMHGFFDERGDDLSDFVAARLEKKFLDEKVKLAFTWLGEYGSGLAANLFGPQIAFYPADATEIELGSFSIDGQSGSKLESMKNLDQVYLRVKYSF